MQRTSLPVLVLVVLMAVAGCNTFSGWWDTAPETPLVTPMDVPTDDPSPTVTPRATRQLLAQCMPDQTGIGFANASTLEASHFAALGNTSLTVRVGRTRIARNGSVLSRSRTTVHIAQNYSRLYFISEGVESAPVHPRLLVVSAFVPAVLALSWWWHQR